MSDLGPSARVLDRAARILVQRIADLEPRLDGGDAATWAAYVEAVKALATVVPNLTPERRGALLTTAEMAERLQLSPKTLLKRKARGEIRPAVQRGKLIRWRGDEAQRHGP